MNDDSALGTVRDSLTAAKGTLSEAHMNTPLAAIVQRGRAARRRRRLIGLTGTAVVAASAAVVAGLTGFSGSAPGVQTAAFTLVSHANRTVTLTINPTELVDAAALQNDLKQYGIAAIVTSGSFCSSVPAPVGISQVVSFYPKATGPFTKIPRGVRPTITFNPAAMPAGAELSFGIFQHSSGEQQADFVLVDSSSYSCSSTPPQGPPASGVQFQDGSR